MATINNSINDSVLVTTFLTSGSWTMNARTKWVTLYLWNAGCGGGSGRQGLTTAAGGGGGGSGGSVAFYESPASLFNSSETVTIGSGGAGGTSQGSATTNGVHGSAGGQSVFGNIYVAAPATGNAGTGGTINVASGGSAVSNQIIYSAPGAGGGGGAGGNGSGTTANAFYTMAGGGGGSGANSVTAQQAGSGANIFALDSSTIIYTGGAGGIESGTINGANGTTVLASNSHGFISGGSGGGGGGGQSSGLSAGTCGNGGFPGGGGGGGGGSLNGTGSGVGGNGANGQIIVIEYF